MHVMNISVLFSDIISDHFCSCFCTPIQNDLLCHILHSSCHRLDIFLVHVGCHRICTCFEVFLCFSLCLVCNGFSLQHQILQILWSLWFLKDAFHILCTSIAFGQQSTCSLVTLLVYLVAVSCLIISVIISSLCIPFLNCCLSLQSFSL